MTDVNVVDTICVKTNCNVLFFIQHKLFQDKPYPMGLPSLGHAVIVNNVLGEMPGSMEDVQALKETYETIGYKVQVHTNLNTQVNYQPGFSW